MQCPSRRSGAFASKRRAASGPRSEEHTSELQSHLNLVCRLLLEKKTTVINESSNISTFALPSSCPRGVPSSLLNYCLDATSGLQKLSEVPVVRFFFFFKETGAPGVYPFSPPGPFPN